MRDGLHRCAFSNYLFFATRSRRSRGRVASLLHGMTPGLFIEAAGLFPFLPYSGELLNKQLAVMPTSCRIEAAEEPNGFGLQ